MMPLQQQIPPATAAGNCGSCTCTQVLSACTYLCFLHQAQVTSKELPPLGYSCCLRRQRSAPGNRRHHRITAHDREETFSRAGQYCMEAAQPLPQRQLPLISSRSVATHFKAISLPSSAPWKKANSLRTKTAIPIICMQQRCCMRPVRRQSRCNPIFQQLAFQNRTRHKSRHCGRVPLPGSYSKGYPASTGDGNQQQAIGPCIRNSTQWVARAATETIPRRE